MLPELPVPGPSTSAGNPSPGSDLLYHRTIVQEASQLLNAPSEALAGQLTQLLANTNVDYVELANDNQRVSLNISFELKSFVSN